MGPDSPNRSHPVPHLPGRVRWLDLYWHAWSLLDANRPLSPTDLPTPWSNLPGTRRHRKRSTIEAVRKLRDQGDHDLAVDAAARRLDQLVSHWQASLSPWSPAAPASSSPLVMAAVMEPLVLLTEGIIGVRPPRPGEPLVWLLHGAPPLGLRQLRLGSNQIDLMAEADQGGGILVAVNATQPFPLHIETQLTTFVEQVPAGSHHYLLTYLDRTEVHP